MKYFFTKLKPCVIKPYKKRKIENKKASISRCLNVAHGLAKTSKYYFLTSHALSGGISSRLVKPIVEDDFAFWLGTGAHLRKVKEITEDPQIVLTFQDEKSRSCLALYGHATIETDLALRKKYCKKCGLCSFQIDHLRLPMS